MKKFYKWISMICLSLVLVPFLLVPVMAASSASSVEVDHNVVFISLEDLDDQSIPSFNLPLGCTYRDIESVRLHVDVYYQLEFVESAVFDGQFSFYEVPSMNALRIYPGSLAYIDSDILILQLRFAPEDSVNVAMGSFYYVPAIGDYTGTYVTGVELIFDDSKVVHSSYQDLFTLIHKHIYGGADLTPEMRLTITQIATIGSIFLAFLPFIIIYVLFLKRWF